MSADQVFSAFRCACQFCAAQADDGSDASSDLSPWAAYYVPDPPKIPNAPGTTNPNAPAAEPGFTGPRFYTLLRGDDWNDPQVGVPAVVPYTFATRAMSNYSSSEDGSALPGFAGTSGQPFNETQRAGIRQALDAWSQVSGLTFIEISDPKQWSFQGIRFLMESVDVRDLLAAALPSDGDYGFNVVFNRPAYGGASLLPGTDGYWTALHEIGHAIGLKHPFDGAPTLKASEDNNDNTVMSYTNKGNLSGLGAFDVAAAQHLYGGPEAKAFAPVRWFQGPGGSMTIVADDQDNYVLGSVARDVAYGGGGGDYMTLDAGDDFVVPGAGTDAVFGGAGADVLYTAKLGRDAAVTSRNREVDEIQGTILMAGDELDTFYGVETLDFVDYSFALDPKGDGGRLYRLYDAAFGRQPDFMGFGHWMDALRDGTTTMGKVATAFATSAEFADRFAPRYGAPAEIEFALSLYENVLGRFPDEKEAPDVYYWASVSRIAGRGTALLDFSEAKEHVDKTEGGFGNGRAYVNQDAVDVLRAYLTVLDRLPDAGGLVSWTTARESGLSQSELIGHLASSGEFQARFGGLSNHDFVERLYLSALDRPAAPNESAYWAWVLDAGLDTRAGVALGFANSAEMTAQVTYYVNDSVMYV